MPTRIDDYGVEVNVRYAGDPSDRQKSITQKRRLVRQAFDKIRHNPNERLMVDMLAKVLGGKLDLTADILQTARSVIAAPVSRSCE